MSVLENRRRTGSLHQRSERLFRIFTTKEAAAQIAPFHARGYLLYPHHMQERRHDIDRIKTYVVLSARQTVSPFYQKRNAHGFLIKNIFRTPSVRTGDEENISTGKIEILRLAGDEFLVLLPNCPYEEAAAIAARIDELREHNNLYHREHSAIDVRPVPVFFGLGVATMGEAKFEQAAVTGERLPTSDDLRQVIDRADARMQANKEDHRDRDYQELKKYFEAKKGREVSMRDERRMTLLTEEERNELRAHRVSHIIF